MTIPSIGELKLTAKRSIRAAIWMACCAVAAFITLLMLSVSLFIWMAERYDALTASLVVAGCYAVLAGICFAAASYASRPTRPIAEPAPPRHAAAWLEPSIVAASLDAVRTIGGRRAATLALGAFAAFWLITKANRRSDLE